MGDEPAGPVRAWPTGGGGFEHFYGFVARLMNHWQPAAVYEGTTLVEPSSEDGYHFGEDMTDKAIAWVRQQKALMPDKPFFMYYAPGATHTPHHVPAEWADRYKGQFDQGWDVLREQTLERQKALGVVPAEAELTARHAEIPAWEEMPAELRPVLVRQAEVYAGFFEHTDHQIGRLVDALAALGALENTLILYILGDNGASAEGTLQGTLNELLSPNGFGDLENTRVSALAAGRARRAELVRQLRGRLGARVLCPLPVDKAGRLALGRHPQRPDRALACRHRSQGRGAHPVPPRDRYRPTLLRPQACRSRPSSTASNSSRSRASA